MDEIKLQEEKKQIFGVLYQFIADIIGADIVEELDITENSTFTRDLEMDSIEIVSFAEKVRAKYGMEIDFTNWLSGMDIDQLINLSLNDVVNFIVNAYSSNK